MYMYMYMYATILHVYRQLMHSPPQTHTYMYVHCTILAITTEHTLERMLGSAAMMVERAFIALVLTWTAGSFNTRSSC